jgi:hypothetical protein
MRDAECTQLICRALSCEAPKFLGRRRAAGVPEGIADVKENCAEWHYVVCSACPRYDSGEHARGQMMARKPYADNTSDRSTATGAHRARRYNEAHATSRHPDSVRRTDAAGSA